MTVLHHMKLQNALDLIQNICAHLQKQYVNAFSQDWSNEANWLVPPIYLLPKCLTHLALSTSGTTGILMLPCWPSATFWPLLFEKQNRFISIIQDVLYLPSTVLEQGDYEGSFIGSKNFDSQVMALYLKVK